MSSKNLRKFQGLQKIEVFHSFHMRSPSLPTDALSIVDSASPSLNILLELVVPWPHKRPKVKAALGERGKSIGVCQDVK